MVRFHSLHRSKGSVTHFALAVSPDNATIIVADGGTSYQLKAYSIASSTPLWICGQQGGYANGPDVTNYKFYFQTQESFDPLGTGINGHERTFVTYQTDGTFWVGESCNSVMRSLATQHIKLEPSGSFLLFCSAAKF